MADEPTSGRASRRRMQTRAQLIESASRLISVNSVAGLRIRDITEEADVGQGSFYNHFDSKEAIVEAVTRQTIEQLAATVLTEVDDFTDPADAAAFAIRRFVTLAERDPDTARLWVNLSQDDHVFEETVRPYASVPLEAGIAQKRFTITDLDTVLIVLTSSSLAMIRLVLEGRAPNHPDGALAEAMLVLFGLSPAESRTVARRADPVKVEAKARKKRS
ncbi:TetR/AcrR family transcriptional regulator [Mycolicibacterium sp. A43C]